MDLKQFGLVDGVKVNSILGEDEKYYAFSGQFCDYIVPKERVKVLDNEYVIILNCYGAAKAFEYATKQ
jgi:hypothetical protein